MRGMLKFFVIVIGLILIALAVVIWLFRGSIEKQFLGNIESNLEKQLGSKVSIDKVSLASAGRAVSLDGLALYASDLEDEEDAFIARFEKVVLYPNYGSFFTNTRIINRLIFIDPEIHVRHTGGLSTNINAIGRHLQERRKQLAEASAQEKADKAKFIIHTLEVLPAKVSISSNSLPIPAIPFNTEKLEVEELTSESLHMPALLTQIYGSLTRALWNLPGLSRFQDATEEFMNN